MKLGFNLFGFSANDDSNEGIDQETERLDELTDRRELTDDEQIEFEQLMKKHYPGYSSDEE